MTPEVTMILDANNVMLVVRVLMFQVLHYIQFYGSLMGIFLLVPDYLYCDGLFRLVVITFNGLAK